jgi:hypothetical protein
VIPGEHKVIPAIIANKFNLRRSMQILGDDDDNTIDPIFNIVTTYLNPKETFGMALFFDGNPDECRVYCRMEGVKIKIKRGGTLLEQMFDDRRPTTVGGYFLRLLTTFVLLPSIATRPWMQWIRRFR